MLTLQDEVASTIAQQINVELTPNEQARFAKPRPVNPEALEAGLKGRYFIGKGTSEGYQKAKECFEQAIKIAPDFAGGYVRLAAVYAVAGDIFVSNQEVMPDAKELLATALRLDDANADAHSCLAGSTGITTMIELRPDRVSSCNRAGARKRRHPRFERIYAYRRD